jgi:hypothetical protein
MAEWPCFEPVTAASIGQKGRFGQPVEACSQGQGSMITEPATDGQRRPLQDFESLYIGVATPAVRRAFVGYHRAESRLCAIAKEV